MGTRLKYSHRLNVYPQQVVNIASSAGILNIPIGASWYDITLIEDITSIVMPDIADGVQDADNAFTISLLVTQNSSTVYTMDWEGSNQFYSSNPNDIQKNINLEHSARYNLTWSGGLWIVNTHKEFLI